MNTKADLLDRVALVRHTYVAYPRAKEIQEHLEGISLARGPHRISLLLGDPMTGKTALVREVIRRLPQHKTEVRWVNASTPNGDRQLLQALSELLLIRGANDSVTVLVVDDCHRLVDSPCAKAIITLVDRLTTDANIRFVGIGQFTWPLIELMPRDDHVSTFDLEPLSLEELNDVLQAYATKLGAPSLVTTPSVHVWQTTLGYMGYVSEVMVHAVCHAHARGGSEIATTDLLDACRDVSKLRRAP